VEPGRWHFSRSLGEPIQVVSEQTLWGKSQVHVWVPGQERSLRLPAADLVSLAEAPGSVADDITYRAAAARIADALERNTLVAPLEAPVIPLPHQLLVVSRAMAGDDVRFLLADEVGLGKTIEAGLIFRELKIRGLVERTLVVAPSGLCLQWVQEMATHFGEPFLFVRPGDFEALRQIGGLDEGENLWRLHSQVVCSIDSVKPMEGRRGWSHEQVARYNQERFDGLVTAGWDLIIADEAHRLGGSGDRVARYQLGAALSDAAPYLLLLSATPHQGKTDSFRRLLSFLDGEAFPDDESMTRERVAPYVIRNEKRRAIDAEGQPLFKPRFTKLHPVSWRDNTAEQRALYEGVTEYAREGYNRALLSKRAGVGFLMVLLQRLVTSSTRAIRTALERRLDVLAVPGMQLNLFPEDIAEEWGDLDAQDQMNTLLRSRLDGLENERAEVELLLAAARRCEARGPDVKAAALLDLVRELQREEADPDLKILIFTEFVATQAMLAHFLAARGFEIVELNGSMGMEKRRTAEAAFARDAQVMVSTEAGGEGLNLQFCHVVVNYDLPWNPMRLEQRIGRLDRIGQKEVVRAFNFAIAETVELRVQEVLEEKLEVILREFGVDKLGDVLDSEAVGVEFDELYMRALLDPEQAEANVEAFVEELGRRARASREGLHILGESPELDPADAKRLEDHQLPFWTERMAVAYLRGRGDRGAQAHEVCEGGTYSLRFPDGSEIGRAVFDRKSAADSSAQLITVEDSRVRALVEKLPSFVPGQPIASVQVPGVSDKVAGTWSLWRIALEMHEGKRERILPLFLSDEGTVLLPTARVVWDHLISASEFAIAKADDGAEIDDAFEASRRAAEEHGSALYRELVAEHERRLARERAKGRHAFDARRRAIHRVGLSQVRDHRLRQLADDQRSWQERMGRRERFVPELVPLLVVRVRRAEGGS
jgi:superfamily II DNA or RNA helicase